MDRVEEIVDELLEMPKESREKVLATLQLYAIGFLTRVPKPPYEWCHGSPTKMDCARRGYCNRDPNCGE